VLTQSKGVGIGETFKRRSPWRQEGCGREAELDRSRSAAVVRRPRIKGGERQLPDEEILRERVVEDAPAAAHDGLAGAERIPGEADAGTEVIHVLREEAI